MADDEESSFKVDYAASNRSTCFTSKELIKQGELRFGVMVQSTKGDFKYPQWHKFKYFEDVWLPKHPGKLLRLSQVSGLDKLKYEDAQKIKALIGDDAGGGSKEESAEDKALAAESKMLWALKEKIKANLEPKEIKELLEDCGQPASGKVFGGAEKTLLRLADGMLFGWLPKCTLCKDGDFIFTRGKYKCTGHISEYAQCDHETTELKRSPWKCPKDWQVWRESVWVCVLMHTCTRLYVPLCACVETALTQPFFPDHMGLIFVS